MVGTGLDKKGGLGAQKGERFGRGGEGKLAILVKGRNSNRKNSQAEHYVLKRWRGKNRRRGMRSAMELLLGDFFVFSD